MKNFILIFTFFLFSGCIPMIYSPYYKPSYNDESTISLNGYCGGKGTMGPSTGIEFIIPNGIIVDIRTRKISSNNLFSVIMKIPSGIDTKFLSNEIIIAFPDGNTIKKNASMNITGTKETIPIGTIYQFEKFCPITENSKSIDLSIDLWGNQIENNKFLEKLEIELPKILVNHKEYKLSSIRLSQPYQTISNEYGYQVCMKYAPEKTRCLSSFILHAERFEEKIEEFNFLGRAYWIKEKNNKLNVHLYIRTNSNESLVFSDDTIIYKDIVNNSEIFSNLKFASVMCNNDSIPITTPINKLNSEITIYINEFIDTKSYSSMDIYLPPMTINGELFNFKPIHLELIIIDGGIIPFNC